MNTEVKHTLDSLVSHPIRYQCRLDRLTSFSIGGPAQAIVQVDNRSELQPLLGFLSQEQIPWRVIGRGTNLLVCDDGFPGVIIILGIEFRMVERGRAGKTDKVSVHVGAGYSLVKLSRKCTEWGLSGLEFGCGIPGTVGGAVIMNAGGWGSDMSSVVQSVTLATEESDVTLNHEGLAFSYRRWINFGEFREKGVVTDLELILQPGDPEAIKECCRQLQMKRDAVQPRKYASGGSFFKNPDGDSAGRLIDMSGLKGVSVGGAMISNQHANFLVNRGGATAEDVLNLMKMVQEKVKNDSGIELEPEIHFI